MDEAQYVPAVQTYLRQDTQGYSNPRNPPLGKEIIALSIKIFGDNYFAYRFPSALAWAGVTGLIFCGVLILCRSQIAGLMASGLWLTSTLAWIHGRLATLDMMTCFFLIAGAVSFLKVLSQPDSSKRVAWLWLSLSLAALGGAVKVLDLILFPWVLLGLYGVRKTWPLKNSLVQALPACFLLPAGVLALSYIIFGISLLEIPSQFALMVRLQSLPHHEFLGLSPWYDWFLLKGNLYYYSSPLPDGFRYSILCANNPVLWIGGSLACLALFAVAWKKRNVEYFLLAVMVPLQVVFWVLFKKQTILSYGLPMEPFLAMALALVSFLLFQALSLGKKSLAIWGLSIVLASGLFFAKKLELIQGQRVKLKGDEIRTL